MKDIKRRIAAGMFAILLPVILIPGCSSKGGNDSSMQTEVTDITQAPTEEASATEQDNITESAVITEEAAEQLQPAASDNNTQDSAEEVSAIETAVQQILGSGDITSEAINGLFDYDETKPLNVSEISIIKTESDLTVHEISYDAYDQILNPSGKIKAYMVLPKKEGPYPCILYFHWLGKTNSDKNEFLKEASALAEQGIAGVMIDGFFPWKKAPVELSKDITMIAYQVIEVRRAIDYIATLPGVDTKRIGYVGHDYGAMFGSVVSGIDRRISSYVFITGMGNFADWFLQYWMHKDQNGKALNQEGKLNYRDVMSSFDPVNFVKNAAPAKLYFQFADRDGFITKETAGAFFDAASEPKQMQTYDAAHEMESEQAQLDRDNWLIENLK